MQLINSQTRLYRLTKAIQDVLDRFGYQRLETQILQPADLFLTKAGDQLIQRLFTFDRFGRQFALRPEFTASAAKAFGDFHLDTLRNMLPARWQFAGPVFEDSLDSGHVFQRYSVGAELINWNSWLADAEIVALAVDGLDAAGCHRPQLTIGSVQLLRGVLDSFDLDSRTSQFLLDHLHELISGGVDHVLSLYDRLSRLQSSTETVTSNDNAGVTALLEAGTGFAGRTREDILRRLQRKSQRAALRGQVVKALEQLVQLQQIDKPAAHALPQLHAILHNYQTSARDALEQLEAQISLIQHYGTDLASVNVEPLMARDWNYYTGTVFELVTHSGQTVAGGGRYNELVRLLGGDDVPAVGMAFYVDRILGESAHEEVDEPAPTVLWADEAQARAAAWWATRLRGDGHTVLVQTRNGAVLGRNDVAIDADGALTIGSQAFTVNQLSEVLELARTGRLSHG
ncbi:MAG: ATP phosphoribosyltransferase regulatory subunit [Chloroflexi bacterium]|nr:ATP phosphoribosyltransferase regulatory subunit [Chloroflexota bacterium]